MSNFDLDVPSSEASLASPGSTAGALLRQARLDAGVHIESIAFALKVPVSKIEALEENDFSVMPDAVFARALAGSVCRNLKIDPSEVLALLPQNEAKRLAQNDGGVNAKFRDGSEQSMARSAISRISWPLVLAVFGLLVGASLLAWAPSSWLTWEFGKSKQAVSAALADAPASSVVAFPVEIPNHETDKPGTGAVPSVRTPLPETTPVASPPSTELGTASVQSAPRVVFNARGETWIQVKDAQGAVVLERVLRSGETAAVTQPGKLSVVVGRADVTEVRVAGEDLNILASARENVARFEVKP